MNHANLWSQAWRFLLAGGAAVAVDFTSFILLRQLDVPLLAANAVAFTLAFLTGFLLNRTWTFQATSGAFLGQMVRYLVTAFAGLLLNSAVLLLLVGYGSPELLAKVCATAVSALLNFILSRTWVFRDPLSSVQGPQ